jgi:lysine 2,3-aminomutase
MPVNNHTVLMKGINDSVTIMRELVRGLLRIKVRPYYLFHCDPVTGAGHFRTSIWKGIEIVEGLRGHVSGLGVPTYVVDGLHGAGKIPVMPNYLLSSSDDAVVLRNYEGMIFRYAPEDKPIESRPVESAGVSRVLSGGGKPLVPAGNPRHERRRKKLLAVVAAKATKPDAGRMANPTNRRPAPDETLVIPKSTNRNSGEALAHGEGTNGSNGKLKGRAASAGGRKPKSAVPSADTASSHPGQPLIGSRQANGKASIMAASAKSNGSRVIIDAAAAKKRG